MNLKNERMVEKMKINSMSYGVSAGQNTKAPKFSGGTQVLQNAATIVPNMKLGKVTLAPEVANLFGGENFKPVNYLRHFFDSINIYRDFYSADLRDRIFKAKLRMDVDGGVGKTVQINYIPSFLDELLFNEKPINFNPVRDIPLSSDLSGDLDTGLMIPLDYCKIRDGNYRNFMGFNEIYFNPNDKKSLLKLVERSVWDSLDMGARSGSVDSYHKTMWDRFTSEISKRESVLDSLGQNIDTMS